MATYTELLKERIRLEEELARYQSILDQFLNRNTRQAGGAIAAARNNVARVQAQLDAVNAQLRQAQGERNDTSSSADEVAESQIARADKSNTQTPQEGATPPNPPSNANTDSGITNDVGTDAPLRKLPNTQQIPPPTSQPSVKNPPATANNLIEQYINRKPGVGSAGDDFVDIIRNAQGQVTNSGIIYPQANSLGKFASYTYNISLYIMSPSDYARMISTKKVGIPGSQLLIQSGGIPLTSASPTPTSTGTQSGVTGSNGQLTRGSQAGRNQHFPLDFYIDDLRLTALQPGKGTSSSHNIVNVAFKIVEPNGISFLDNLYKACEQYVGKKQNYAAQNYLLVIKFYGYDQNGNLLPGTNQRDTTSGILDNNAIIEKFIPIQFTGIKFKITNNITEYNCEAVCPQYAIAASQARGVIPYNTEIQATTLSDLFGGPASYTTTFAPPDGRESASATTPNTSAPTAPPKATAAPKPTITGGLVEALNLFQEELVNQGTFDVADQYEIKFLDKTIANSSTVPVGNFDRTKTGFTPPATAAQAVGGITSTVQTTAQTKPSVAGTTIIQFIDQALRTSAYIQNQQTKIPITDPTTGKQTNKETGYTADVMSWYRIGMQAVPIKYDQKRRDYAYKITYSIAPFLINDLQSDYFPKTKFRGTHKKYSYWYTGENTEVLNFEQDFNYLYYIVVNSNQIPKTGNDLDWREEIKRSFQPRSNESDQGQEGKVNEPSANAAERLYSPADLARARLTIVGDPAWIPQGEVWKGIGESNTLASPFFPDGTINTEIQEPLFEIAWNKPVDYDLGTGLLNPNDRKLGANDIETLGAGPSQSYIYRAVSVTSTFSKGKFTQDLEGVLVTFPSTAIKKNKKPSESNFFAKPTEVDRERVSPIPVVPGVAPRQGVSITTNGAGAVTAINKGVRVPPPGAKPGDPGTGARYIAQQNAAKREAAATSPTNQGVSNGVLAPGVTKPPTSGSGIIGPAAPADTNSNYTQTPASPTNNSTQSAQQGPVLSRRRPLTVREP